MKKKKDDIRNKISSPNFVSSVTPHVSLASQLRDSLRNIIACFTTSRSLNLINIPLTQQEAYNYDIIMARRVVDA